MNKAKITNLLGLGIVSLLISGCASWRPIPEKYLQEEHEVSVTVPQIPPKPMMADSGQGGIVGLIVTGTSRSTNMKEQLEGLQGETIGELLRQTLERRLESKFYLALNQEDLLVEVIVTQWGWFLPTTVFGIKSGTYQCVISGYCNVYDLKIPKKKKKQRIAFSPVGAHRALGDDPEDLPTTQVKQTMIETVDAFAEQIMLFITQRVSPERPYYK